MKNNFSTKKILISVLILNILAAIFYVYLFSEIKNKNIIISSSENILNSQSSREAELKLVGASLKETKEKRLLLDSFFVQKGKSGVADFVGTIEDMAKLSKVSLSVSSILIKQQKDFDIFENLNLGLEVKGSWSQVTYFLGLLESLPYKISFERVYIEKNGDKADWNGIFNISVLKLSDN